MPDLLILGRGSIGKKHEANAKSLGWNVVTVDPDPKAEADYIYIGCQYFSHAVIATPIQDHISSVLKVRGACRPKHILIEKPLTAPLSNEGWGHVFKSVQASTLESLKDSTTALWLAFNWRFNSTIQRLKSEIDSGYFGKIEFASLTAREYLPQYLQTGVLLESGSHILDTARWLFGELEVRGAYVRKEIASIILTGRETGNSRIHEKVNFTDNTVVSVNINICNQGDYDYWILIQGDSGRAGREYLIDRGELMHLREMEAFLGEDKGPMATLSDGLENMRLIEAVMG